MQFRVSQPMQLVITALAADSERPHKWGQRHELPSDWDAAPAELGQAMGSDGLADIEPTRRLAGWVVALRGDAATAEATLAALLGLRASEAPQDQATISVAEAFTAAAADRPEEALRCARATLATSGALGLRHKPYAAPGREHSPRLGLEPFR